MIRTNQRMLQILYDLHVGKGHHLSPRLKGLLDAGIIEEDGCWFLTKCRSGTKNVISEFQDRTGLECFVNKIHIEEKEPVTLQEQGYIFVDTLRQLLEPRGVFNIIMGLSYSDFDGKPDILTCNVRFHKVRAGESWLRDDLETYKDDGLLVLTTGLMQMRESDIAAVIDDRC
jgi:hypothetical protein